VAQQEGAGAMDMRPPGVQALEAHQHTLSRHLKNEFFNRNLSQNIPNNAYFLEKGCKIAAAPWGSAPEPPLAVNSASRFPHCYSHLLI